MNFSMRFKELVKKKQLFGAGEQIFLQDHLKLKGICRIVVEEDGISKLVFEDHNLIVNVGRRMLAHLLAEVPSVYAVTIFKVGTMGHDLGPPEDILVPIPPQPTDTSLIDPSPFVKDISSFAYSPPVDETTVTFTSVLERPEANGGGTVAYTEAGLFCVGDGGPPINIMFCRETFAAVVKTDHRRISFLWSIIF